MYENYEVKYYVAECEEFPSLGYSEYNLTLDEAVDLYNRIPGTNLIKCMGIMNEEEGIEFPVLTKRGGLDVIDSDNLYDMNLFRNNPNVIAAIENIKERFPNASVLDFRHGNLLPLQNQEKVR